MCVCVCACACACACLLRLHGCGRTTHTLAHSAPPLPRPPTHTQPHAHTPHTQPRAHRDRAVREHELAERRVQREDRGRLPERDDHRARGAVEAVPRGDHLGARLRARVFVIYIAFVCVHMCVYCMCRGSGRRRPSWSPPARACCVVFVAFVCARPCVCMCVCVTCVEAVARGDHLGARLWVTRG